MQPTRTGDRPGVARRLRGLSLRVVAFAVAAVSLYVLAPSLVAVFGSWRSVVDLDPAWLGLVVLLEAASFVSLWELQRITLRTRSWFVVGTSQLAGNALGHVVPGGLATAGALQFQMLTRAGVPAGVIASGLTAASGLTVGVVAALPVLSVPAFVAGAPVQPQIVEALIAGIVVLALLLALAALALATTRPLEIVAASVQRVRNRLLRHRPRRTDFAGRAVAERDALRRAVGDRRWRALLAGVGNIGLDYLALLAALAAVGSDAAPSLVLLAYVAAVVAGLIPFTPGGLGFVEAGLTGMLVLVGASPADAVLATLVYRLASFWLPLPVGLGAYAAFSRRYPGARRPSS